MKISTSILKAENRMESIVKLNNTSTDYIHIDSMDGKFVPNKQLPVEEVNELAKISQKPFDIHLMLENPIPYIKAINFTNIESITIHAEIKKDINKIIKLIKDKHVKVGLAINPKTDITILDKYLKHIDKILIMSVEPGFGGQTFQEKIVDKIVKIKNKADNITLEVDGGINNKTIKLISKISDIAVVGSYITNNKNYEKAIKTLKK